MRRRTIAYSQELQRAAKLAESQVESAQRRVCPTCGAQLGRDLRPPSEGVHVQPRPDGRKNPRGSKPRI
jgi:hypothetical protein